MVVKAGRLAESAALVALLLALAALALMRSGEETILPLRAPEIRAQDAAPPVPLDLRLGASDEGDLSRTPTRPWLAAPADEQVAPRAPVEQAPSTVAPDAKAPAYGRPPSLDGNEPAGPQPREKGPYPQTIP